MRPRIVTILILVVSLFNSIVSFGQAVKDSKGPPPPNTQQRGPLLPIDDSIILLLVAGLLLGVYFLVKKYRSKDIPA